MVNRVVSFKCDEKFLELIEKMRLKYGYIERSEFIRDAIRFYIFYLNTLNNNYNPEKDPVCIEDAGLPEKLYRYLRLLGNKYNTVSYTHLTLPTN